MRLVLAIIVILLLCGAIGAVAPCHAQTETQADTISIVYNYRTCDYYLGYNQIGSLGLRRIMRDYPEATSLLTKADACRVTSSFLMVASGACIGLSMESAFRTGWDNETASMVAGVVLAAISFDLDQRVYKHRNTAVKIFNNQQMLRSEKPPATVKLGFTGQGVGLVVTF